MKPKLAQMSEAPTKGEIEGVVLRKLRKFADARGWLSELFRKDELPPEFRPEMSYVSITAPGVTRGPHEHAEQTDLFAFLGPSNFKLRMWDNRPDSSTVGVVSTIIVGEDNPVSVLIPKGVVHAYQNVGTVGG